MMNKKLLASSFLLFIALQAKEIQIKVVSTDTGKARIFAQVTLRQEKKDFYCHSSAIPDHKIQLDWLKSIDAPKEFRSTGTSCERKVHWGNTSFCETPFNKYKMKELLRWCTQM